jgi:ribosomal protein L34
MDEDAEHTLIYVDMLGFAALTERHPIRLVSYGPDEHGYTGTSTSPLQTQYNRFHHILESCISEQRHSAGMQAMLYSDCAYLDAGNSVRSALIAVDLMQKFLRGRVPARMGIGRGTFYAFGFSIDVSDSTSVTRSLFAGTAVIHAHAAERSGGKGMRIFVHPSLGPERHLIDQSIKMLPLPKPNSDAAWELSYLYKSGPAQNQPPVDESDLELFEAVKSMKDPKAAVKVRRQHIETHKALNRMRRASGRKIINLRRLKSMFREPGTF